MVEGKKIKVTICRFNPKRDKAPNYVTYEVPYTQNMTVLTALNYVYENIDNTLSYQYSCKEGLCHACDMIVNGAAVEACSTVVHGDITVEPPWRMDRWGRGFKVIKDLIADDILYSERDHTLSSRNQAFRSLNSLAKERSLNHAVIRYLKSVEGKEISEETVASNLGITLQELRNILKELEDKIKPS